MVRMFEFHLMDARVLCEPQPDVSYTNDLGPNPKGPDFGLHDDAKTK